MRQLKYHEKKLLKKVDFLKWKSENNLRELQVRNFERGRGREKEQEERTGNEVVKSAVAWPPVPRRRRKENEKLNLFFFLLLFSFFFKTLSLLPPSFPQVMRRYHIQARDDYQAYNRMVGLVTRMVSLLRRLPPSDETRIELTDALLERLYSAGVVPTKASLASAERLSTASLARRRLAVVMVRLRMAQTVKEAATFVEQGHVRVGPHPVADPAHHVSRSDEDFVTWVDASRVRRAVAKYNDALDDFDLLGA